MRAQSYKCCRRIVFIINFEHIQHVERIEQNQAACTCPRLAMGTQKRCVKIVES